MGDEKEVEVTPHLTSPIQSHSISSHPGWGVPGLAAGFEMRRRGACVCVWWGGWQANKTMGAL